MALAFIAAQNGSANGAATTGALGTAIATNDLVVVGVIVNDESITISMSDNGGTPMSWSTAIGPIDHSGATVLRGYIFYAIGNGTGATTVTATPSAGTPSVRAIVHVFSGNATTSPLDQTGSGEDATTTTHDISGTVTTTQADEVLCGFARATSALAPTAGADYTIPANGTTSVSMSQYRIVAATGDYSSPWTSAANETCVTLMATFKALVEGGGRTTKNTHSHPLGVHSGRTWRVAA
jgi:hypothetical protein